MNAILIVGILLNVFVASVTMECLDVCNAECVLLGTSFFQQPAFELVDVRSTSSIKKCQARCQKVFCPCMEAAPKCPEVKTCLDKLANINYDCVMKIDNCTVTNISQCFVQIINAGAL